MKCGKKRVAILIGVGVVAVISLTAILTLSPFEKKSDERFQSATPCTSNDCFFVPDKIKKPIREVCDSEGCFTTDAVTKSGIYGRGMCTSKECVLQAAKMLRWIDGSVDPCEHFYNFSCGKFLSAHALPDGWTSYGVGDVAEEGIALRIKGILEKSIHSDEADSLKRVKLLYKSCLNISHIERHSASDLKRLLSGKGVGDWPFLRPEWNDCRLDLEWRMAKLNALGVDSLVSLDAGFQGDDQHAFLYMTVAPPLVEGICDDDEENETIALDNALKKSSEHIKMVKKVLSLLQVQDNNETDEEVKDMFLFDYMFCNVTKLSQNGMAATENREWNQTLHDLRDIAPEINWGRWRNILLSELGLNFPQDKFDIYVHGVNESIDGIVELVHNTSSRTLANYLTWKFVSHHLGFLGPPFRQIVENRRHSFKRALRTFMDSERWRPRWHQCVLYVENLMPISVLLSYLPPILTQDFQREMDYVVSSVKNAFRDVFRKSTFLLRDERVMSINKIDQVHVQLYYPDKDRKFFDKYYFEIGTLGESFIKNGLKVKYNYMRKLVEGAYFSKTRYDLEYAILLWNPFTVNAWSAFLGNQIVISLGEIESNQISSKFPRFLSLSTLGATVGQMLTHGFDLTAIKSSDPESYNWTRWPDYAIKNVERRAQCAIDKYFDKKVNSDTISIIDDYLTKNQGIHLAFKAYMNYVSSVGVEKYLPGLSFTSEQLFFIRYAQTQCKIVAPGTENDPAVTTNRVLQNSESFSETFNCPKDSAMNPTRKCGQLWA